MQRIIKSFNDIQNVRNENSYYWDVCSTRLSLRPLTSIGQKFPANWIMALSLPATRDSVEENWINIGLIKQNKPMNLGALCHATKLYCHY